MGRKQQWVKLTRPAMLAVDRSGAEDKDQHVSDLVMGAHAELARLAEENRRLQYQAIALARFLESAGVVVYQRPEDEQWTWRHVATARARNGDRQLERHGGAFPLEYMAMLEALRRIDEDYGAWRASQDLD